MSSSLLALLQSQSQTKASCGLLFWHCRVPQAAHACMHACWCSDMHTLSLHAGCVLHSCADCSMQWRVNISCIKCASNLLTAPCTNILLCCRSSRGWADPVSHGCGCCLLSRRPRLHHHAAATGAPDGSWRPHELWALCWLGSHVRPAKAHLQRGVTGELPARPGIKA